MIEHEAGNRSPTKRYMTSSEFHYNVHVQTKNGKLPAVTCTGPAQTKHASEMMGLDGK